MEGTLWKWTNYFSGWQPRWFVLEDGILSYYRSQEDVVNGCKGSVKMSVCDVIVHGTDTTRLDLIIPGEAHFYVKAATPQERQTWLVALGTSKAGLMGVSQQQQQAPSEEFPEEQLRSKKSELRLYCDLLMQQVHSVKQAVSDKDAQPDIEQLNEATSLLSATCDTFISALDDCMTITHATPYSMSGTSSEPSTPKDTKDGDAQNSPQRKSPSTRSVPWGPVQRSISVDRILLLSQPAAAHSNKSIVTGPIATKTTPNRRGSITIDKNQPMTSHQPSVTVPYAEDLPTL